MSRVVGAYVCPRGVYLVECRDRRGGLEVLRRVPAPGALKSAAEAATHLVHALASAGLRGSSIAIAIRGFDVGHHVLSLPPANESVLRPVIEREVRRLEPQLAEVVVGWAVLPEEPAAPDAPPQIQVLAAAAPRAAADIIASELSSHGHRLLHLTVIPAAVQRLQEEFDGGDATSAFVVPLPDGAFLGFFLHSAVRLAVEPPLQDLDSPDAMSMAEELELGAMFVRQQFRGAHVDHVVLAGAPSTMPDAEETIAGKLGVPVHRLDVQGLGPADLVALGAILDGRAATPLSLAGSVATKRSGGTSDNLRVAATIAVAAAVVVAGWTMYQALQARTAAAQLADLRAKVEQNAFGLRPMRETADQRRLMRDAVGALRLADRDRGDLPLMLGRLADAIPPSFTLDSIRLDRGSDGWVATLGGGVVAESNGRAVQALHEFYRDLPARIPAEQLNLEQLAYADSAGVGAVRFVVSFVLPARKD